MQLHNRTGYTIKLADNAYRSQDATYILGADKPFIFSLSGREIKNGKYAYPSSLGSFHSIAITRAITIER